MRSEPAPVIDMADDVSVHSEFSYLTGDSEGHSTVDLSNVQMAMAPQLPTNVPHPTALPLQEVVVKRKETVASEVTSQVLHTAPTVTVVVI